MVTDDLDDARLLSAVRVAGSSLIGTLDAQLFPPDMDGPALELARITGLLNSIAWHVSRPGPAARLNELLRETKRQQDKLADDAPAHAIYATLREAVGSEHDPGRAVMEALRLAGVTAEREAAMAAQARLVLGLTLLDALQILHRGASVRREVQQQGGAIQWR